MIKALCQRCFLFPSANAMKWEHFKVSPLHHCAQTCISSFDKITLQELLLFSICETSHSFRETWKTSWERNFFLELCMKMQLGIWLGFELHRLNDPKTLSFLGSKNCKKVTRLVVNLMMTLKMFFIIMGNYQKMRSFEKRSLDKYFLLAIFQQFLWNTAS